MSDIVTRPPSLLRLPRPGKEALLLRPPDPRDAGAIAEAIAESLPELKRFMAWAHFPQTVDTQYKRLVSVQAEYWSGDDMVFHVWGEDRGTFLGCVGLHQLRPHNPRGGEIGYWMRTSETGQGVASRGTMAVMAFVFGYRRFLRVECGYNRSNEASARVSKRVGFSVEAEARYMLEPPTEEMQADGAVDDPVSFRTVMLVDDLPGVAWYQDVLGRLEVYDWLGRRVDLAALG